ncbi:hypothetical protein [Amycolatopsis taiwanensis]|uniref:hypothetical protein n=1 Tax=Amycolatopsis taiwanensis TaxID=342230 RepID=UPI0012EC5B56|nr:hypothetical protein [Amycolatopsis taiwanensis]
MAKSGWTKPRLPRGVVNTFANQPGHKHTKDSGTQINATTVRWQCRCEATIDEIDAPPRRR